MPTLGAEIEKPISDIISGQTRGVSQEFFKRMAKNFSDPHIKYSDIEPQTILGVSSPEHGSVGLDNAFNLQETSSKVTSNLEELHELLKTDLRLIQQTLLYEGATVINLSIHPLAKTDTQTYKAFVAPKGIYKYISQRGWDHTAGIDAKAQNSPSTGVSPENAAKALTTIIGASAAFIGLFANSPFAEGKISQFKETRLNMWTRFMKNSISEGDRTTSRFPEKPFETLAQYFYWMFGPGTNIHFVMASEGNYKTFGDGTILIDGNPSVIDYLRKDVVKGHFFNSKKAIEVKPNLSHMEVLQFAQFTSARIRWAFNHDNITKETFLSALENDSLEDLFSNGGASYMYIEGRDPGANFPDKHLQDLDENLALSTIISPSAIQSGLINNLQESNTFIRSVGWSKLNALRHSAIQYGLDGEVEGLTVKEFASKIVEIAGKGLEAKYHPMLDYPKHVLKTDENGADRALSDYNSGKTIQEIVISRNADIK